MKNILIVPLLLIIFISRSNGENILKDDFTNENEWTYIADNVMGGISDGRVEFNLVDSNVYALLSGNVSTENNGGFIQIRRELKNIDLSKAKSIRVYARGNNEKYYIFLRTTGTILPWQYYSHEFTVNEEYNEFIMHIQDFKKSGTLLAKQVNPKKITSVAIVAYGRDHVAEIYVKELEFIE
tara:strand:- start:24 stop:569 length:546 start_codon:yes stop_codon:yes gene_type:complete